MRGFGLVYWSLQNSDAAVQIRLSPPERYPSSSELGYFYIYNG